MCTTYGGLVALAPHRLRREVGAVGLREQPVGGDAARGLAQVVGVLVGDVAGERDVPASLERGVEQARRGEAVEDDGAVVRAAGARSVSSSAARVWMTTGLPSSPASASCRSNRPRLRVVRRVVAVVVEPGLADGDRPRVREQLAQLVEIARRRPASCGWTPRHA